MEINPIVVTPDGMIAPLDLAGKIDETAAFLNASHWGHLDTPAPFGRKEFAEEAYIRELDSKTGASLKLTILNHSGRIWTMVAGGGASVVYADTISGKIMNPDTISVYDQRLTNGYLTTQTWGLERNWQITESTQAHLVLSTLLSMQRQSYP